MNQSHAEKLICAAEEAGHAIASKVVGYTCPCASIFREAGGYSGWAKTAEPVAADREPTPENVRRSMIVHMAGRLAVEMLLPPSIINRDGPRTHSDAHYCIGLAMAHADDPVAFTETAKQRAVALLASNFDALNAAAVQLAEYQRLTWLDSPLASVPVNPIFARPFETPPTIAGLRGSTSPAFSDEQILVDRVNGIIHGAAIAHVGQPLGHPFFLDEDAIQMFAVLADLKPDGAVLARSGHPEIIGGKPIGETPRLGDVRNIRVVDGVARGDVHFDDPLSEDASHLLNTADEDPTQFGLSAFFYFDVQRVIDPNTGGVIDLARPLSLEAIDVVRTPAANRRGLLCASVTAGRLDGTSW